MIRKGAIHTILPLLAVSFAYGVGELESLSHKMWWLAVIAGILWVISIVAIVLGQKYVSKK
jgi:hypothetical protein